MQVFQFRESVITNRGDNIVGDSSAFSTLRLISGTISRIA
jgi:hypothetical protein